MNRFRKFIGREIILENVKDSGRLDSFGVVCTYLSDPPEDFDEAEFRTGYGGKNNIVLTVATEMGIIKRVLFSEADQGNQDLIRSLSGPRLEALLSEKGEALAGFFEYITR
ncbi:MAG: hypothetical protein ACYC4H_04330 [Desulfocucumaceae bacterium]